ncbi:MAG: TIGR03943 family protein [Mobilitalea sp.]
MRIHKFNPQAFIEFLCYLLSSLLFLNIVTSNKYLSYVTPRMKPYLIFTSIVMAVWAVTVLFRLFEPKHKLRVTHCFVIMIPVVLLILPHKPISASDITTGYVNINTANAISVKEADKNIVDDNSDVSASVLDEELEVTIDTVNNQYLNTESSLVNEVNPDDFANSSVDQNILKDEELSLTLSGFDEINKVITISDKEFYPWLVEIFTNMDKFDGYKIIVKAFVFKGDEELKENEFIAARLLMSCCSADLVPCGIICQYNESAKLKENTWITVEGVLHIGQYQGNNDPQIIVSKISAADKPEDEYIYPY